MVTTAAAELDKMKADFLESWKSQHNGSVEGAMDALRDLEPRFMIASRELADRLNGKAAAADEQAATFSQKRSEMTTAQKADFVHEHGVEAFQGLPA